MSKQTITTEAYVNLEELLALRHLADAVDITALIKKQAALSGLHMTRSRGRGMDFDEVRIYQPGDDVRSIDWRVTARTQKPHTKLYREERERPVMILADQSASLFFGSQHYFKSVLVARLAALIAWSTIAHGDRVGSIVFSNDQNSEIRPRRHKQAVLGLINTLIEANHRLKNSSLQNGGDYLKTCLSKARYTLKSGGRLVILSDFDTYDESCYDELFKIAQHNQVILVFVYDPLEENLPPNGWYSVSNHKERLRFNTSDQHLRESYNKQFETHKEQLKQDAMRCGMHFIETSTLHDVLQVVEITQKTKRYASYA